MKKIGVLLESMACNKYLYETVDELSRSGQVELFYLLNRDLQTRSGIWEKIRFRIKAQGLLRFVGNIAFKSMIAMENRIYSVFSQMVKDHNKVYSLEKFNTIEVVYLTPDFSPSGIIVRYPDEDVNKIQSLKLDIIIRGNAPGILKGSIIGSAKEGIISFHHGDNRWNRGVPPAFWEVYLRKPTTGFVIQMITEELDGGAVLFRGNIRTRRSYTGNVVRLYNESNPYLAKIILQYAASNILPPAEEGLPFGGKLLRVPSVLQSLSYLLRTVLLYTWFVAERFILHRHERWGIAFHSGAWCDAVLRKGVQIKNPPNHFFADPFVITINQRTVCFVEDYSYLEKRGCITAIELIDKKNYAVLGPVIVEPFHMSFPYLFEYEQALYMVPETREANSIRLYKCVDFPSKWEFCKEIMNGICVVDSMVFEYRKKWWLLTNMAAGDSGDGCSQLFAYYSDSPLSNQWIAHKRNPLIFDSSIGRNGGILDIDSDFPIRIRQKQGFNSYGSAFTLAKIEDLTPSTFHEIEIGEVLPHFFQGIQGCHHIHSNDNYTVYDYVRFEAHD